MGFLKIGSFLSAVMVGLAAVLISLGALTVMTPALAQGPEVEVNVPLAAQPGEVFVDFTDPQQPLDINDLSGNSVGEGIHQGQVKCKLTKCSKRTHLAVTFSEEEYEYKFDNILELDLEERRVVVAGSGSISSLVPKAKFSFTAIFKDNDGTIRVTYVASRPDASFIVPGAPGTMTISGE